VQLPSRYGAIAVMEKGIILVGDEKSLVKKGSTVKASNSARAIYGK
jgi:hypothetical protein